MSEDGKAVEPVNRLPEESAPKLPPMRMAKMRVEVTPVQAAEWRRLNAELRSDDLQAAFAEQAKRLHQMELNGLGAQIGLDGGTWRIDDSGTALVRVG